MSASLYELRSPRITHVAPAPSRQNKLPELIQQLAGWVRARLEARRSIIELSAMDDRLLRDIGLRRDQLEGLSRYGRLHQDWGNLP